MSGQGNKGGLQPPSEPAPSTSSSEEEDDEDPESSEEDESEESESPEEEGMPVLVMLPPVATKNRDGPS